MISRMKIAVAVLMGITLAVSAFPHPMYLMMISDMLDLLAKNEIEGEATSSYHPADGNEDWQLVLSEAIAYLAGWQQGANPMAYAIRAAYLWQNGEQYHYDAGQSVPLCWMLGPVEGEGEGPEVQLEGDTVSVPGAMLVLNGIEYPDSLESVSEDAIVGIVANEKAYLYSPMLGNITLSDETSRRAVGCWLVMHFANVDKVLDAPRTLDTGILVSPDSSTSYIFENKKKRWAAVVSGATEKPIFLSQRGPILDLNLTMAIAGEKPLFSFAETALETVPVNEQTIKTFGAIVRNPLWPFIVGTSLITKDTQKSIIESVAELWNSVDEAMEEDMNTFVSLNAVDVITVIFGALKATTGLVPGECIDAAIDGVLLSSIETALIQVFTRGQNATEMWVDTIDGFSEGILLCAASEGTVIGAFVSTLLDILAAGAWIVDDAVLGSYDSTFSLAYDTVEGITSEGEVETETILLPGGVPLEMVWIPGDTFQMGRYPGEVGSYSDEDPQHAVTVPGFWLGKYEVTKAQWTAVMGTTPWSGQSYVLNDPDSPAVYVSWNNAQAFITALNTHTGQAFRLPSEAEWEYACRAGTTTRFYWGDDPSYTVINDYAWWDGNADNVGEDYAHVVGLKLPNGFGLFDMSGNVWEWCEDDWHSNYTGAPVDGSAWVSTPRGSSRVLRGGNWNLYGGRCRSADRGYGNPSHVNRNVGFRLSRS